MLESDCHDVIVVGGGPAGSTTAALVARGGARVLLLERETFPRYKIGESLIPETWGTLERLGVVEQLRDSHFPKKHSVQFFGKTGRPSSPFYFSESPRVKHPQTWQVVRSEFDQILLDNCRAQGVEVHEGVNVREVILDGDRATGVRAELPGREVVELGAKVVVDASGNSGLLATRLKLREEDPKLRNASMFTYFEGAQRDPGRDEGATLVLNTESQDSWFWYIPLPEDRVSVGVVAPLTYLLRPPKRPPQEVFDEEVSRCPGLLPRLEGARQVAPVQALKDFTYRSRQRAGDGWVLVGDAYGFIDPLYSSGVFLALKSGEMAADAILDALAAGDWSASRLGRFETEFLSGMDAFRKLVHAFYDKEFSIAGFLKEHPQYQDDIVQILVGNVFREDVHRLFTPMAEMTTLPAPWT
ncbi:MAG: tryptophan 7-halogenase [Acidobacteria bacterium]|nr:tryptophan 7-halogenase [Acidobacteriota bacterium]